MLRCRLIIIAWVLTALLSPSVLAQDIKAGFGGIAWTTPLEKLKNCRSIGEQGKVFYCVRPNQSHTLMGEPLERVTYGFFRRAFFAVFFRIEDEEAFYAIQQRLNEKLGIPESILDIAGNIAAIRWTDGPVRIELNPPSNGTEIKLAYYYAPLADKAMENQSMLFPQKRPKVKLRPMDASRMERAGSKAWVRTFDAKSQLHSGSCPDEYPLPVGSQFNRDAKT